ncbi:hypothetical protein KSS87_005970 [Heliosperma pusillum]|nr:hypothetical protein KSS87_005970 [Heliosperma pusillum]
MESYIICGCFSRKFKKAELQTPMDVTQFFNDYSEGGTAMSPEQLTRFMVDVQGDTTASVKDAEKIVEDIMRLKHHHSFKFTNIVKKSLNIDDFFTYLFSVDINPPIKSQVHQDMSAPLSHYFIYTGHNSYLTGNQLSSDCSEIPIIRALQRGVRVIELDLWPTPNKEDVHVLHGKTLTTPVGLLICLKAIKNYAFCASPYPVILTLEDHLNPKLQAKVAHMITRELGDMLFCPESEITQDFPSPEDLKYKVLISTKPPKEYLAVDNSVDKGSKSQKKQHSGEEQPSIENKKQVYQEEDNSDDNSVNVEPPAYKKMITIPGIPRGKLKESLKVDPNKLSRLSWSEQTLAKATASCGTDIVRANGGCGYIKKPDFLLKSSPENEIFDPKSDLPIKITLKVKVYMGDGWHVDFMQTHFDLYSPPDFYVKVGIAGVAADEMMKKTRVIEDRWIPVWDEEFGFPLTAPEVALLRVEVHEYDKSEKDDFAGQTCLPVSELRPGIHAVPLYSYEGVRYHSVKLLMHFMFV